MWDLPRPGLEPVSPALAGRFSTTAPPGKPHWPTFYLSRFAYSGHFIQMETYTHFVSHFFHLACSFKIHPCSSMYQYFMPFYGWTVFHWMDNTVFCLSILWLMNVWTVYIFSMCKIYICIYIYIYIYIYVCVYFLWGGYCAMNMCPGFCTDICVHFSRCTYRSGIAGSC